MTKQSIKRVCILLLMIAIHSVVALGEEFADVGGVRYELCEYDGTAAVVEKRGGYQGEVYIPPFITHQGSGYMVTRIGNHAFDGCADLYFVYIPETVHSIGRCAFRLCCELPEIMIPSSVETIGESAFQACFSLRYMHFGADSKLTHIGDRAFCDCWRLCRLKLPESVRFMGEAVFEPSEVLYLGRDAPPVVPISEVEDDVFEAPGEGLTRSNSALRRIRRSMRSVRKFFRSRKR